MKVRDRLLSARGVARLKGCTNNTPIVAVAKGELPGKWKDLPTGERILLIKESDAMNWTPPPKGPRPKK